MMSYTEKDIIRIRDLISEIEKKNDIEIVLAVDNGSRSMGLHTEKSDFDIRFIFVHNKRVKHVIGNYPRSFNMFFDDGLYDFDGWSLDKMIGHLKESNPTLIEWLYSPLVFVDKYELRVKCKEVIKVMHNKLSMFYHYSSMAEKNYNSFIKNKETVEYKKYMYIVRPLLMLMNLETDSEKLVISDMPTLHDKLRGSLSEEINIDIERAIELKKTMKGIEGPPLLKLNNWIEEQMDKIDEMKEKKSKKKGDNMKGRSIISNYSKMKNEVRKLLAICKKNEGKQINRTVYLATLFSVLDFLWVWQHQDRDLSCKPTSLKILMADIYGIPEDMQQYLVYISDFKETVEIDPMIIAKRAQLRSWLVTGGLALIESLDPDIDTSILKTNDLRADLYDYLVEHALTVLWLANNTGKGLRDIPKSILTETKGISEQLHYSTVKLLRDLRPVYMLDINETVNKWVDSICDDYKDKVTEYSSKLQQIKEINARERYKQSIVKIDQEVFTNIVDKILFGDHKNG